MLKLHIMDHTGHSMLEFTAEQKSEGFAMLEKLLAEGGKTLATRKTGESDYTVVKSPKQVQDEALLIPQRQGG